MSEEQGGAVAIPEETEAPGSQVPDTAISESAVAQSNDFNMDIILNVPVEVSLQIGRANITIGELLQLSPGSVVELDRSVGEPHDVLVNGTLIAHGEVVVVDDQFGIRFTDIVSPQERVKRLQA